MLATCSLPAARPRMLSAPSAQRRVRLPVRPAAHVDAHSVLPVWRSLPLLPLATAGRALAEEVASDAADPFARATDAASVVVPASDDPVVTVLFTLAVAALSVISLGVAYLSLTSWLDGRAEEEDRKRSAAPPPPPGAGKKAAAPAKDPQAARTPKGFGKKE